MAAESSAGTASRVIGRIFASCEPVRRFPHAGAPRDHLAPGLRAVFRNPYAIYYVATADAVVIIRVVHGARDIDDIAAGGGFTKTT
ncbi:type II toxin-antitoxin system RelE/ParE family toxin [Rhodoplanes roseus]|uniref:type II toxin-antitoxin system RelE/ParE family toxin n=1 Tax=Rhodoplanes roseus TaxID=29409 RepID=UPI003CCAE845